MLSNLTSCPVASKCEVPVQKKDSITQHSGPSCLIETRLYFIESAGLQNIPLTFYLLVLIVFTDS